MTNGAGGVRRRRDGRAGVYVHVPFCDRICPYCDFAVTSLKHVPHEDYAQALLREWEARASELEGRHVRSIYFGGGTPSKWSEEALARVLGEILGHAVCDRSMVEEVTIEANPVDIRPERLATWQEAGVNRISLGCQSFQDDLLQALGRQHTGARAFEAARIILEAGLSLSIDLIYGHAMQTMASWREDLEKVRALMSSHGLGHVSGYFLTIEEGTPFYRRQRRGEVLVKQDDGESREMVDALCEVLAEGGVRPYEVSSYGAPGKESVHNSNYWLGGEYLGLGMGAHGLRIEGGEVVRRQNTRHLKTYLVDPVGSGAKEGIGREDHLDERLFVAVRSRNGLEVGEIRAQFDLSPGERARLEERLERLCEAALLEEVQPGWFAPTWEGMQVADMVGETLLGVGLEKGE